MSLPMSARRAAVGDRLRITCVTVPPSESARESELLTTVVTVESVTRLGCGCDRAETSRPFSAAGPCPGLHLLPASCAHGSGPAGEGIDFDAAREAARTHRSDVHEPVPPLSERLPRRASRVSESAPAVETVGVQEALL